MCGIAGFAGRDGWIQDDPAELLRRMCGVIRHRGPDDEGFYLGAEVGLGMRRLAIIDLATGRQPIASEDRSVWVVFNGEIYNYRELRRELAALGHQFATASDTETIVHAYEEWGEEAFARLRGMFGIALWDDRRRTLYLARDRAGIKPLHYSVRGSGLLFGSEVKSILAAGVERAIDLDALDHYLTFLYTPRETTIFRGILKLPPGHLLRWRAGRADVVPYWEIPAAERPDVSEEAAVDRLRALLAEAVSAHLVSDVPLGAFLSGGIDSSVVVALMAAGTGRPVKTFSVGFDEREFDELAYARLVARRFGTDHHEFIVKPDAVAILNDLVDHFDEPFADASAIPTWYVSQVARRHVTVVLSGDGGDELFGGYDRYVPHPRVAAFDRLPSWGARQLAAAAWPRLPHGWRGRNFLRHVAQDRRGRYLDAVAFFRADERRALLTPDVQNALGGEPPEARLARRFERFGHLSWAAQMMRFDFETYLPGDVLTKVDRMSMAHSLESRVPLLDNEVIEWVARLPAQLMIQGGRRKHLLKRAAEPWLPPEILNRRKQGFAVPIGVWFQGGLRSLMRDVLLAPRTLQRGYFHRPFVERLVGEHLSGRRDHRLRLWQLLMFELWHRRYLDARPDEQWVTNEGQEGSVRAGPGPETVLRPGAWALGPSRSR